MSSYDVVIVGTGFSGLGMAIALQEEGKRSYVVLEKGDEVGGTWRDNHYPGCACDVPSPLYSFSFAPNPKWSRLFAEQREILAYLKGCADKYKLRPHIRFGREVIDCVFDEKRGEWTVACTNGERVVAKHLVFGTGALSRPAMPDIAGMDKFSGKTFHSQAWDHAFPLEGKRVAVIGTGASAIQLIPKVAERAKHLTVYQRTPPWIIPRPDRPISAREQAWYERVPLLQKLLRGYIYTTMEARGVGFHFEPRVMKLLAWFGRRYIKSQIRDPELRAKVTPNELPGCKRILLSDDYYPALAKRNVELVTDKIERISETGIVSADREREFDAIIYATGFRTTDLLTPLTVRGKGGVDLNDAWREGIEAYLGTNVAGYPNMHMLMGPNTGLGHTSMVYMIESQVHYALEVMKEIDKRGALFADVRKNAQDAFNARLVERNKRTVWASGCKSWYLDKNGKNPTTWPGFTFAFRAQTRRAHTKDYLFAYAADRVAKKVEREVHA